MKGLHWAAWWESEKAATMAVKWADQKEPPQGPERVERRAVRWVDQKVV